MKKKIILMSAAILFSLASLPRAISYAEGLFQQSETGWVVWETAAPVQSIAWDGSSLWAGQYKDSLTKWNLETGQSASYNTADGLSGNHILSIAVDGAGQKWLTIQDGGLNLTNDGTIFIDLTPAGEAGQNAWDLSVNGSEVWLATLGGGVSRYSSGSWTTYNKANSNLPFDDIYAIAANNCSPWVGTIGYGVANLQGGGWVGYTLPVQVPDPLQSGSSKSNQAVTDIAIDVAGNKWFATDGSGVVVLDASNSSWTVYDTSNSGISGNFIQRIYIDPQGDYWFGTLGGGVSRLSAKLTDWETYNTSNSPLPEDDVLDLTKDDQGGLWLAGYDTGLAYFGSLPLTPPEFKLDPDGQPDYIPGKIKGYFLWENPETFEWILAWSGDGTPHTFTGEIVADAPITVLEQSGMEAGDSAVADGNGLVINASEQNSQDSVTFKPALAATELTIRLKIDGAYYPYNIHVGGAAGTPGTAPFRISALQPQAPMVNAGEDITINEGDYLVLSADVSDTDSPVGHTYTWDLGDGTKINDTLFVDHIFKDDGTYNAQITVKDISGLSTTDSVTIIVQNVAPSVDFFHDLFDPDAGDVITFSGSFYDPGELDTHTITWNFGDGTVPVTGQNLEAMHTYDQAGSFGVSFTVTDNDGGSSSANATIVIAVPPTPTPTPTSTFTPTKTPAETSTPTPAFTEAPNETLTPNATPVLTVAELYFHGTGSDANPETLFLNTTAPDGSTAKYMDSDNIKFNNGNPWKEVGTWAAAPLGVSRQLTSLNDLRVWLGLQDSSNQYKSFDLRAEVYKNNELIASGETLCIADITGRDENAKEATLSFNAFDPIPLDGATDSLSIKILARVGTDGGGNRCGVSNSAVGLRLYFDITTRLSKFGIVTSISTMFPSVVMRANDDLSLVSFAGLDEFSLYWDAPESASEFETGGPDYSPRINASGYSRSWSITETLYQQNKRVTGSRTNYY
jgi:PKD repeat protein